MIDRVEASKRVGWHAGTTIEMPTVTEASELLKGVEKSEQDAYENVLRVRRYATTEQYNSAAGQIIEAAYRWPLKTKTKHIHL